VTFTEDKPTTEDMTKTLNIDLATLAVAVNELTAERDHYREAAQRLATKAELAEAAADANRKRNNELLRELDETTLRMRNAEFTANELKRVIGTDHREWDRLRARIDELESICREVKSALKQSAEPFDRACEIMGAVPAAPTVLPWIKKWMKKSDLSPDLTPTQTL